jgi:hypothetical protein
MSVRKMSALETHPAGASVFPHSRQAALRRGVINPQNGHIRCEAKPRSAGLIDAINAERDALNEAMRLRKRSRKRCLVCSIKGFTGQR